MVGRVAANCMSRRASSLTSQTLESIKSLACETIAGQVMSFFFLSEFVCLRMCAYVHKFTVSK